MTDPTVHDMAQEPIKKARDGKTRWLFWFFVIAWLAAVTFVIIWLVLAYSSQKTTSVTLAEKIQEVCQAGMAEREVVEQGTFTCKDAENVAENDAVLTGPQGPQGPKGDKGDKGDTGAQGGKGDPGTPGKSGGPGTDGEDGQNGSDGAPGVPGADGSPGADGPQGPMGPEGPQGPEGKTGPMGPEGPQGPTGLLTIQTVGCEGPVIASLSSSYNAETRTITISCNTEGASDE